MSASYARRGVTLIEVLLSLVIFMIALVPVADLFSASNRTTAGAARMLESSLHAQRLLEAVAQLEPLEIPPSDDDRWLLVEGATPRAAGGGPRWLGLTSLFARPPPFEVEDRTVIAQKLSTGHIAVTVKLVFLRIAGEPATEHTVVLETLLTPRSWP